MGFKEFPKLLISISSIASSHEARLANRGNTVNQNMKTRLKIIS